MSRQDWIIEHANLGAYLGDGQHPRKFTRIPLFRADNGTKACMHFVSMIAAQVEFNRICAVKDRPIDHTLLSIIPAGR